MAKATPADPVFDATLTGQNRTKATMEIVTDPTAAAPLVWSMYPTTNMLDGFKPTTNVQRTALFNPDGTPRDKVTVRVSGAKQGFQTEAPPSTPLISDSINKAHGAGPYANGAKGGQTALFRYTDGNGMVFVGQGVLVYDGEQGQTPEAVTIYGFGVEWESYTFAFPT